jgi:hypothetical protein
MPKLRKSGAIPPAKGKTFYFLLHSKGGEIGKSILEN